MTVMFVILSLAALAWGAVLAYRGSVVWGCAVFLVAASCFSADFWSFEAAGLTWTLDRFYFICLVGVFAAQAVIRRIDHKPIAPGEGLLAAFLLLVVASTFTHDWQSVGPDKVPVLMHLVNGYLIPAAVFWIAREAILTERSVRAVQILLACLGLYLAVTAICEIAQLWPLVFPPHIADPSAGIHFGRARGPMLQSAVLGTFLIACCAATWTLLAWLGVKGRLGMLLTMAVTPIYLAAIYFTYTRSVWMGAGLALAVVLGLILQGRTRYLALGGLAAAAVLVLAFKGSDLVSMKRETSGDVTRESTYMRGSFLYVSWQMFKDRPLTGVGFGQYPRTSTYYLSDRDTQLHLEAIRGYVHHITFMSILVELGIVGLALYLLVLFDWLRGGWLLWRDPSAPDWMRAHALLMLAALAPFLCQLLFRDVSYSLQESALIFLLAGVTSGLRSMRTRQAAAAEASPRTRAVPQALGTPAPSRPA